MAASRVVLGVLLSCCSCFTEPPIREDGDAGSGVVGNAGVVNESASIGDTDASGSEADSSGTTETTDDSADSASTGCGVGDDVVVNGGFDSWEDPAGVPLPWLVGLGTASRYENDDGDFAATLEAEPAEVDGGWLLVQTVVGPFVAGEPIEFSGRFRLVDGQPGGSLRVELDGAGFPQGTLAFAGTTDWEELSLTLTPTEDVVSAPLRIQLFNPTQTVLVDDLELRVGGCPAP